MHILIVDDESLARSRLRRLVLDCDASHRVSEAEHAAGALALLQAPGGPAVELLLLDIRMPGMDGMVLARQLQALPTPPALVFVTAHAEHALGAFELDALDYLTKPVRLQRLQQALAKVQRSAALPAPARVSAVADDGPALLVHERGRTERVPLAEVLYLRAELKYVTVRAWARSHIVDEPLSELEARHAQHFVRVHRNTLVARHALRALVRHEGEEGEGWAVRLHGVPDPLPVSRRQVAAVREALAG
ncbi:two component transcriptional regulator, LytTR family [Oryzisolibacter propanilivorax]|uniref:Two component transcriptional regulator, LytTR family n=1 Tax=Oryzisolibacter propanilivorax TaxID=1527607 RepID=A0A1G9TJL6_9BURK|nr:LytTR family DNA-binding domain-containing protein [Oryzisolibacter propanilivorax]SDM47911.1 two component transcriptional regulator, LytTR family [Oryzisolibacter propanilivorax]